MVHSRQAADNKANPENSSLLVVVTNKNGSSSSSGRPFIVFPILLLPPLGWSARLPRSLVLDHRH